MTVKPSPVAGAWAAARGPARQLLLVVFINVPTVVFGMSLAWVSLAGARGAATGAALAGGAGATHAAGVLGALLAGGALRLGRLRTLQAASAAFALCWGLKLAGGAGPLLAARVCAGLAGAATWCAAPLLGQEISSKGTHGAASAAPVLAHNFGFLLMYLFADLQLPDQVILWSCLGVSALHAGGCLLLPESPPFLAARGEHKKAVAVLAWLRGQRADSGALAAELEALPAAGPPQGPLALFKDLWSHPGRRKALVLSVTAVAGQECCGLLALLQFAEPVFAAAAGEAGAAGGQAGGGATPARHALQLGAVQLAASAVALYLVERVGRRPLIVWTAVAVTGTLGGAAAAAWGGGGAPLLAGLLAAAVAADSLGMQSAPYALLNDMFHYEYRGCAMLVAMCSAAAGNALEVLVFALAAGGGLAAALALAGSLTALYALFALLALPETRGRSVQEIYDIICPQGSAGKSGPAEYGSDPLPLEECGSNPLPTAECGNNPLPPAECGSDPATEKKPADCVVTVPSDKHNNKQTQWTSL